MNDLIKYAGKSGIREEYLSKLDTLVPLTIRKMAEYIPGMEEEGVYDIDDYILFDEWFKENPCVFSEDDDEYSSIRDLAPAIINAIGWDFEFDCEEDDDLKLYPADEYWENDDFWIKEDKGYEEYEDGDIDADEEESD